MDSQLCAVGGSVPYKKKNITVRECENGFIIHFDINGFVYGEKSYVAHTTQELLDVLSEQIRKLNAP